jgi:hypothetical protein
MSASHSRRAEELQDILKDQDRFDVLFESIPSVEHVRNLLTELNTTNQAHAERNLNTQSELNQLHTQITDMNQLLDSARANLIHLHERAHVLAEAYNQSALLNVLEERRDGHARQAHDALRTWHTEMGDIGQFIQTYRHERTQFHLNAMYVERLVNE